MILHRLEPCFESHPQEGQHGFCVGRRLEKHLVTANSLLDKTLAANIPVWVLSLNLSKPSDQVDWGALWLAVSFVRTRSVKPHVIFWLKWKSVSGPKVCFPQYFIG